MYVNIFKEQFIIKKKIELNFEGWTIWILYTVPSN